MGRFQIQRLNNQKSILFQNLSPAQPQHVMCFEDAQAQIFFIHNRIERMKNLKGNANPIFIIDETGISSCAENIFAIQAFRLNDFMLNKLFISHKKSENLNRNISSLSEDEKRKKMDQFQVALQSIQDNRTMYCQAFFKGYVQQIEITMKNKIDFEYMPLHQYHAELNDNYWGTLIPLFTTGNE